MSERDDDQSARPGCMDEALGAARAATPDRPELPPELAARLLADARVAQPRRARLGRRFGWPGWLGWPDAAALAASLAAGLWLGLAPPAPLAGTLAGLQAGLRAGMAVPGTAGDLLAPMDAGLIAAAAGGADA